MADTPSSDLVVETFKLTKIYRNRLIALNDVTLRLEPGCVLGLLGANGAGKTTLLRLLIGPASPHRRLGQGVRQDDDGPTAPTCAAASATSPPIPSFRAA